ncbi:MAG: hypothetical protein H0X62_16350, partial [Bacteroidetes bacterium]|nr:hypothetical protein [Bacteroidota bacterium]
VRVGTQFPDDIDDAVTYNLEDQIGSSTVRLNTTGAVIDKEEYYPFGDSSLRTFTKKRYRYVGKEKDLESGFIIMEQGIMRLGLVGLFRWTDLPVNMHI